MSGFRVGVVDPIIAARPAADTFIRMNYLMSVARGVDSYWVPDHLNQLLPRSLWKQKYCGAIETHTQRLDAAHGAVDHARAPRRAQPDRPPAPRRGCDRQRSTQPGRHRAGRRDAALAHPRAGRSWVSALASAKETSPTGSTGPSRSRDSRRRWPPSARFGIRAANSSTGTRPTSRCATRYSICHPIAASGPRSGSVHTVRACCAPRAVTAMPIFPPSRTGRWTTSNVSTPSGPLLPTPVAIRMSIIPAVQLFVVTGRTRDDVDEALDSELIRAFALNAPDELFSSPRRTAPDWAQASRAHRICSRMASTNRQPCPMWLPSRPSVIRDVSCSCGTPEEVLEQAAAVARLRGALPDGGQHELDTAKRAKSGDVGPVVRPDRSRAQEPACLRSAPPSRLCAPAGTGRVAIHRDTRSQGMVLQRHRIAASKPRSTDRLLMWS